MDTLTRLKDRACRALFERLGGRLTSTTSGLAMLAVAGLLRMVDAVWVRRVVTLRLWCCRRRSPPRWRSPVRVGRPSPRGRT
ncbi:hypothetical protein IN07_13840 [Modestobacter caceresii]|uniref:Uncharacterized protein n=1 Tax=Modestobacter caceresii TaxID=1522368 RepID=A0A098Y6A0_9ACTN|nr:hypothetical protein [Modestobacter caceresii]KGH46024.1 hypothetical protein IN07_13840 [Modestobacter caceresii]